MAVDRVWMYRQPRVWETLLNGVNGFLAQAEADMRNRSVPTMHCPCVDCVNQKKFGQWDNIFHHLITRGLKKITHVGISMVRKALLKAMKDALMEVKRDAMLKALMKGQCNAMPKPLMKVKRVHNDLTH